MSNTEFTKPRQPGASLRRGYTTGACATAAAVAAAETLCGGYCPRQVTIMLPGGQAVSFAVTEGQRGAYWASSYVIKDAGDDPDVTHGAKIGCSVHTSPERGIRFARGEGVGLVTLPGLPVSPGEPAINPVPRQMMASHLASVVSRYRVRGGLVVQPWVENGGSLAEKTLNPRLGIIGGLSILGTTGIVRPFSTDAYIASIRQALQVAKACGCRHVVLSSGGRTERAMRELYPQLPEQAFIQYGNWIGEAVQLADALGMESLSLCMMLGKAVKLAEGRLDTHSRVALWTPGFVAEQARRCGYSEEVLAEMRGLMLAQQIGALIPFKEGEPLYEALAARCLETLAGVAGKLHCELRLHNEGAGWLRFGREFMP